MCSAQKNQDGIILVIVMFMLAALTSLSLVGSQGAQTELRIALNDALAARALAVAESGIDHATDLLAAGMANGFTDELNGGNGTGGSLAGLGTTTTLADGNLYRFHAFGGTASDGYYVRIVDNFDEMAGANNAATDLDSRITIIAVGQVGRAQRVIEAGVGAGPSLFDVAVFGEEGVSLDSNACTDSYDSTQGAYGGANVGTNGDVGTNATNPGAITLLSNACVKGDAVAGPGANPSTAISDLSSVGISGAESAVSSPKDLPAVIAPTGLPNNGNINLSGNCPHDINDPIPHATTASTTITASGAYTFIRVDNNDCVVIDTTGGDVTVVTGSLELLSNAHMDLIGAGSVTIYVTGNPLTLDSNTKINNNSQDPTTLQLLGTDAVTNVTYDSNSAFYGAIYTRNANITIDSNADIYGAVIANRVDLSSTAEVHYDEALGNLPGFGVEITYWREVR